MLRALRTRNFSKRPVTENTPPAKSSPKSSHRTTTRRTRKNPSAKFNAEQARKKAQKNPVRLNVVFYGSRTDSGDVEMQDAQPPTIVPVLLPRAFLQPPVCEPSEEAIAAASGPDLPAAFIRDQLESLGPKLAFILPCLVKISYDSFQIVAYYC